MATKQQEKQKPAPEGQDQQHFQDAVGKRVLQTLGQPSELNRVQVRRLWGNHFRVNVLVGNDSSALRIAHSYFLTVDDEGGIVAANPTLKKHY